MNASTALSIQRHPQAVTTFKRQAANVHAAATGTPHAGWLARPVVHKPSRLLALTQRKAYRAQLQQYKAQRQEVLYQNLMRELREPQLNMKRVAKLTDKLIHWGHLWSVGRFMAVPPAEFRASLLAEYDANLRGIRQARAHPAGLNAQHTDVLAALDTRIERALQRIKAVDAYEERQAGGAAQGSLAQRLGIEALPHAARGSVDPDLDDDGAPWTLINDDREPSPLDTEHEARTSPTDPQDKEHWKFSDEGAGGAILIEEELKEDQKRARRPTLFAGKRHADQNDLAGRQKLKATKRTKTVIKTSRSNGYEEKNSQQVHDVLDKVARRAPEAPRFGFPQHRLARPDGATRQALAKRVNTADTRPDRIGKRDEVHTAILDGSPILEQQGVAGTLVSEASLWTRIKLFEDPKFCADTGAGLIQGPFLGLGDHHAPDGMGFNSWSNWFLPPAGAEGPTLTAIDLSPRPGGLDDSMVAGLKRLLKGIQAVARQVGPQGELPPNWHQLVQPCLGDFLNATFTVSDGLFKTSDFMTGVERQQDADLEQGVKDLQDRFATLIKQPAPRSAEAEGQLSQLERAIAALSNERGRIARAAKQRGNVQLAVLRERAAPHILKGVMQGLRWLVECGDVLVEAHAPTSADAETLPGFHADNIRQIQTLIEKTLTPDQLTAMSRLARPAVPAQGPLQTQLKA